MIKTQLSRIASVSALSAAAILQGCSKKDSEQIDNAEQNGTPEPRYQTSYQGTLETASFITGPRLEIPAHYQEAFKPLPVELKAQLLPRIEREFSNPDETSAADFVRLLADSMIEAGYSREEAYDSLLSFLAFGSVPSAQSLDFSGELKDLFPANSAAAPLGGALSINWLGSANDPYGMGKLEFERLDRTDPQWMPSQSDPLLPELWVSSLPFSEALAGAQAQDSFVVDGEIRVWVVGHETTDVFRSGINMLIEGNRSPGFGEPHVIPIDIPLSSHEHIVQYSYDAEHRREGIARPIRQFQGEVYLRLLPVTVDNQNVGYRFEPLGPQGKELRDPELLEGFVRSSTFNMFFMRKEALRQRAMQQIEDEERRSKLLGATMPEIGLRTAPAESGYTNLNTYDRSASLQQQSFPGVIQTDRELKEFLKGKLTLVDFWTTWCGPCLASIPKLNEIHSFEDMQVIGILDGARDQNLMNMDKIVRQRGVSYPIAVSDKDTFARFGGSGYPSAYLIDWREGDEPRLVWAKLGAFEISDLPRN